MIRPVGLFVLVTLLGCSSTTMVKSGPCALRKGTYTFTMTLRDGNCSSIPEQVVNYDEQQSEVGSVETPADPCTGQITVSGDNCRVQLDQSCPYTGGVHGHLEMSGEAIWAHDASSGQGLFGVRSYDGNGGLTCSSSFDVNYQRH